MISKIWSSAVIGVDGIPIEIEVDTNAGLPAVIIVGIPDVSVRESKERVKSALRSSGFDFPVKRIVINLAPADIKKEGTLYDLPIALSILLSSGQIESKVDLSTFLFIGELSLDGRLKPIKGILPMVISAREIGKYNIVVPKENEKEAGIVSGINVFGLDTFSDAVFLIAGIKEYKPFFIKAEDLFKYESMYEIDFNEVAGQKYVKRALEIACAGAHNLLMIGPPGSGKSMIAKRIPTILPEMVFEEALEATKIHSIMGLLGKEKSIIAKRPFRNPHHTISDVGLVGGGSSPMPGEVSLAHNGVLFLDELPEFKRQALEVLRQPLEDKEVTIVRALKSITYPSNFMLVAAMNPCPCGYLGDRKKQCKCNTFQVQKYHSKLSGPLLDRIDIHVEVPSIRYKDIVNNSDAESSACIRERINSVRKIQGERFKNVKKVVFNSHMERRHIKKFCEVEEAGKKTLQSAIDELNFSARVYDKILKVSRTIADLEQSEIIKDDHLSEAIRYRNLDRDF